MTGSALNTPIVLVDNAIWLLCAKSGLDPTLKFTSHGFEKE